MLKPFMARGIAAALIVFTVFCATPDAAQACACGCGVFDVGTSSMFPSGGGGTAWLEYNYMNQDQNWHGTSKAPAANNDDKDIRSSFYTAGMQYMFSRQWGLRVALPYWDRYFQTDDVGLKSFTHSSFGDARIMGVYTGISDDMSTGLLFGAKLPTGDYTYPGFDRDTSLGTGSTDALLGAYHMDRLTADAKWSWFAQGMADIPALTRGGYRPGSDLNAALGVYFEGWSAISGVTVVPVVQTVASAHLHDSGPASDAPNSGYKRLFVSPGLELNLGKTMLYADVSLPVYQDVKGDQLVAPALFKVTTSYRF